MTKPSRHSSVASAFFRATPLRLVLPALALVGAVGLFVSGCGDDSPTTPTPAPTPAPTPTPTPPAPPEVPTGLAVASVGPDYIEWTWTAVEDAASYDIQMTLKENDFTESQLRNIVAPATSARFTVAAETQAWARVRAKTADAESDYSAAVSGTSDEMPLVLTAPTNLQVAEKGARFIEWTWNAVTGATAYEVQLSLNDQDFTRPEQTLTPSASASPMARFTVQPETTAYIRVRAVAGEGAAKVESPWSQAFRGESDQLPLGVPTGLEISATGQDFIEARWDAVEGATGYTVQLDISPPYNFSPTSRQAEATTTSHRFTGLVSGRTAHVRVRSTRGRDRGDYSDPVVTATAEPPVVPIGTPTGLSATGATRTQVTINWPDVTRAVTYEVQQRVGSSGNWGDATCDEDDNEVEESECTATGLESGTEYQFRVRAVPVDDDDDLFRESAWSSPVSATTTGRAVTGGSGGAGELNITWRSDATSITWRWDQAGAGVDFEYKILDTVLDTAAPCDARTATWLGIGTFQTSHVETITGGDTSVPKLLCVRTKTTGSDGEPDYGDPSWTWGVSAPKVPVPESNPVRLGDTDEGSGGVTEALIWTVTFSPKGDFDYEFRYDLDEVEKTNDNFPSTAPTGAAAQTRCDGLDVEETISPSGDGEDAAFTSSINLEAYASYRMCYRAVNDDGSSEWSHAFAATSNIFTRPTRPSVNTGRVVPHTNQAGDDQPAPGSHFGIEWTITTNTNAPMADTSASDIRDDYEFYAAKTTGDNQGTAVAADKVIEVCNLTATQRSLQTGDGVVVLFDDASASHVDPPDSRGNSFKFLKTFGMNDAAETAHYYLCVRAKDQRTGSRGEGPSSWVVSNPRSHKR